MSYETDEERLTKKQRREEARAQRKELEAAELTSAARRRRLTLIGGALAVLVVAAIAVLIATTSGGGSGVPGSGGSAGLQATPAPWAPEDRALATRMQALNLPAASDGGYHVHAVVHVYANGRQTPVASEIGVESGIRGQILEPLHTHDTTGLIHIEANEKYPFTLGQFFTIWGVKFTNSQLGSYVTGKGNVLAAYVNGKQISNPVGYVMNPHDKIVLGYGKPGSFPASFEYRWPTGL